MRRMKHNSKNIASANGYDRNLSEYIEAKQYNEEREQISDQKKKNNFYILWEL
jgi:hypothetical protein